MSKIVSVANLQKSFDAFCSEFDRAVSLLQDFMASTKRIIDSFEASTSDCLDMLDKYELNCDVWESYFIVPWFHAFIRVQVFIDIFFH
jgi:hypothetical protein